LSKQDHVFHPHVVQMQTVVNKMVQGHVFVLLNILVTHMKDVALNAQSVLIVLQIRHASLTNAEIHALEPVVAMLIAKS
jgi:hypothetical protein